MCWIAECVDLSLVMIGSECLQVITLITWVVKSGSSPQITRLTRVISKVMIGSERLQGDNPGKLG